MRRSVLLAGFATVSLGLAGPVWAEAALELAFPGPAETTAERTEPLTSFRLPVGPFADGALPTQLTEGALRQTAFRIALPQPSTLELIKPLRDQIVGAGFKMLFECETDACGGYDFRFGTDVMPEPDMHVDLSDFRYLAASRQVGGEDEFLALMVSRSAQNGFVQLTQIGQPGAKTLALSVSTKAPEPVAKAESAPLGRSVPGLADLGKRLELGQSEVLEDLVFTSGSSSLSDGEYISLKALADWLKEKPSRVVTLVGHTDASGGLAGNINLSRLRAESVRQRLLRAHGVAPEQVAAEGVGYLAPRDSNQTETGRQNNRRVEVIATSTELLAP